MEWNHFIYFALPAVFCWGMGAMAAYRPGKSLQVVLWTVAGLAIFMAFVGTTAIADDGGDAPVVLLLPAGGRNHYLYSLAL